MQSSLGSLEPQVDGTNLATWNFNLTPHKHSCGHHLAEY